MKTLHKEITDKIISALETAGAWERPWKVLGGGVAKNVVSKKPYKGINSVILMIQAHDKGYSSSQWGTYKQWKDKKCQVKKGEKATRVIFWKFFENKTSTDAEHQDGENTDNHTSMMARSYSVFNADQVDGWTPEIAEPATENERVEQAERFFGKIGADIRHGGDSAHYLPSGDYIQMPELSRFKSSEYYYSTLAHEAIHWTGAKNRLDRDLKGRFGSEAYAVEELIAELGAAFLSAHLGLSEQPRDDHAQYVASWIKVLKSDNRAIFTAASKAQAAVDFMQELQELQG